MKREEFKEGVNQIVWVHTSGDTYLKCRVLWVNERSIDLINVNSGVCFKIGKNQFEEVFSVDPTSGIRVKAGVTDLIKTRIAELQNEIDTKRSNSIDIKLSSEGVRRRMSIVKELERILNAIENV